MNGTKILASALAIALAPAAVSAVERHGKLVTTPVAGTPLEIALGYLDSHKGELGLTAGDIADFVVSDQYMSKHNGVTHVYLQQRLGGIDVVNGLFNVNVMGDGRILHFGNRFVGGLADAVNTQSAAIEHEDAIAAAAQHFGLDVHEEALRIVEVFGGPALKMRYDGAGISQQAIPVGLEYLPLADGRVQLVWSLVIRRIETPDWWNVFVDARTGEVLDKFNWTADEDEGGGGCTSNCYTVYATPGESPDDGPRTVEDNPADGTASPFGWHDTDGAPGAEFTDTRGNNVEAQTDLDANNDPTGETRAEGGPDLIFNDPIDLGMQPETYLEAAVGNLFYWINVLHDVLYRYGFDEASGNFQTNNYGNGGLPSDAVQADAQDGSGTNGANFGTPPDGLPPRMQLLVWTNPNNAILTVNSPGPIAGDYMASHPTDWSGPLTPQTTADLEIVDDGSGAPSEGCGPLVGFTPGNIALIDRGNCEFGTKSLNAQNAGAAGAIIVNNQQLPNGTIIMGAGGDGNSVTIPAIMIGNADGQTIRIEIPTVNATITEPAGGAINRDSDLDNGVITHEYGHGVSNRLTGGPNNVGCLQHGEQAGEGWSDWWTLALFTDPADTETTTRGVGNYDVGTTNVPHGVGEIWAVMLWEMYWQLVNRYGFDEDLYTGVGGNNLAIQLVIDGMKLQPCSPTFVDARDAILAADLANNGGANDCEIWNAFAKRGLGFSADAGGTGVGDETEAFDLPPGIPSVCTTIFEDGFESGDTSAWSNTVP
jgi:hypothetical protein